MEILSEKDVTVVVKKKKELEGIQCDRCGKIIEAVAFCRRDSNKYFEVMTGHKDWGAESGESIEHKHICPDCIIPFITDYISECKSTEYIEIETNHCCPAVRYV